LLVGRKRTKHKCARIKAIVRETRYADAQAVASEVLKLPAPTPSKPIYKRVPKPEHTPRNALLRSVRTL
jgi:hypothetical protein